MNLFSWLRAHILYRQADAANAAAQRASNKGLRMVDELLKGDPTNEKLLAIQRDLQALLARNRINQASISTGKDWLATFRR
jgi:hypothetical protein